MNYDELLCLITERYIISEKNLELNLDKWGPGYPLFITGTSGDGKSTLAKKLGKQYGTEVVSTDVLLTRVTYDEEKWNQKMNSSSFRESVFHNCQLGVDFINEHPDLPRGIRKVGGTWSDSSMYEPYFQLFFNWIFEQARNNPKYNNKRIIVEGCDICLMDPNIAAQMPLIVIGCSRLQSSWRRIKRDVIVDNHSFIDSVFREIRRSRGYIKELNRSKDLFKKRILKAYKNRI